MNYEKLVKSIKENEGLSLTVYDCPAGKKTIGYGRNLEDRGISENEANLLLQNDISNIKYELTNHFSKQDFHFHTLPNHVQNVLIEMAFQMGVNGLLKFKKTIMYIKYRDFKNASIEMLDSKWAKQTPKRAEKLSNLMKGGF
jgi:lysozyme